MLFWQVVAFLSALVFLRAWWLDRKPIALVVGGVVAVSAGLGIIRHLFGG